MTGASPAIAPILETEGLSVEYRRRGRSVPAVDDVSLSLRAGTTLAVVGESGSGKSTLVRAIIGTLGLVGASRVAGIVRVRGADLTKLTPRQLRTVRGRDIGLVAQDSLAALNPLQRVGLQVAEPLRIHERLTRRAALAQAIDLLARLDIAEPSRVAREFPHQLSGGMRQRVALAIAVSLRPAILLADEPTSSLDTTVRAQILDLLAELQRETGMAVMLITHDLTIVEAVADQVAVMYAGRVVETASVNGFLRTPRHPYSAALVASRPAFGREGAERVAIAGTPPRLDALSSGCAFHPRCPYAIERCLTERPKLRIVTPVVRAACHRVDEP